MNVEGKTVAATLDSQTDVDDVADTLTFKKAHGFANGDLITYHSSEGDRGGLDRKRLTTVCKCSTISASSLRTCRGQWRST